MPSPICVDAIRPDRSIINVVGISGDRPDANYIAGSCANAALIMFSRSLGGDSIRHGVRVVAVNPGPVETEKHIRDTERLAQELHRLCAGRGKLLSMAERARQLAKPNAASELADACGALARTTGIRGVA